MHSLTLYPLSPAAGYLSTASRLREAYVTHRQTMKSAFSFSMMKPQTNGGNGQYVFNLLIKVLQSGDSAVQKLYIGGVNVLKNAYTSDCSQAIVSVVHKLDIYGKTLCGLLPILLFRTFLKDNYPHNLETVKFFWIPVITRWNGWFKSVEYLNNHLSDVVRSYQGNSTAMPYFLNLTLSVDKIIQTLATFFVEHFSKNSRENTQGKQRMFVITIRNPCIEIDWDFFDLKNLINSILGDISGLVKCVPILNQLTPSQYLELFSVLEE
ncbi:hypothetical protein PR048_006573 [Dryococelus australis]|uniref:Uncharacterized protein n=1 Tax=Dryococelus australis TaxID=614101 RepID=A0ABQ9IBC2_9NEOP|nr:hypothetical protein PR048_006573 [Dryococelus australis]